jgi:hypothetical protein
MCNRNVNFILRYSQYNTKTLSLYMCCFALRRLFQLFFGGLSIGLLSTGVNATDLRWSPFSYSAQWAKDCDLFTQSADSKAVLIKKSLVNKSNGPITFVSKGCKLAFQVKPSLGQAIYLSESYPTNADPDNKGSRYWLRPAQSNATYWVLDEGGWEWASIVLVNKSTGVQIELQQECAQSIINANDKHIVAVCSGPYAGNNRLVLIDIAANGEIKRNQNEYKLPDCDWQTQSNVRQEVFPMKGVIEKMKLQNTYTIKGSCDEFVLNTCGRRIKNIAKHRVNHTLVLNDTTWSIGGIAAHHTLEWIKP